jgi:hypothetical protein
MKDTPRIPECKDYTFDGMLYWFAEMSANDLLFHPDDDPSKLTRIANNEPMFNAIEVHELRKTLIHEAYGYPVGRLKSTRKRRYFLENINRRG